MKLSKFVAGSVGALFALTIASQSMAHEVDTIPDLRGTWEGENKKISKAKGMTTSPKMVFITEQKDRRFKGYLYYKLVGKLVRKDFFGVIYPDNVTLSWVATDSVGYVHGRVHSDGRLSACYIETGIHATAGCSDLKRTNK